MYQNNIESIHSLSNRCSGVCFENCFFGCVPAFGGEVEVSLLVHDIDDIPIPGTLRIL